MAVITRVGYGQVEENHLSALHNGQIYAQLPAAESITQLENGQFAKYDYAAGEVNYTGEGEWMLVLNEVKLYDGWRETRKDYAQKVSDSCDGKIYPRLMKTHVGDIMTLNTFKVGNTGGNVEIESTDAAVLAQGEYVAPNANGFLDKVADATGDFVWKVVAITKMPDAKSIGVKLQRIK